MSALAIAPGSIFARDYLIERALAEGGMGAVYVVRQMSTGRHRALKLMQPELAHDDDFRRRFLQEAKIGASIASEHVVEVQVAGIDEKTGAPYLVMELLDGVDLQTRIEEHGALSHRETRELFRQMCHALRLAHDAGIVHRDLKPQNVFLAKPKRADDAAGPFHVKVLDFGIAKMTMDATAGGAKTGMIGTPLWMAPEQADHVPVTPAADVWALGLILYTSLTGRLFWRSAQRDASLQQIMREMLFDPIPPAGVRAEEQGVAFPAAFESVVSRAVLRRPEQRLRNAGEFFDALEEAFAGKTASVRTAPISPTSSGLELDDAVTGPSLELAEVRRRPASIANPIAPTLPLPDAHAITRPASIAHPAPIEILPVPAHTRPLLADGRSWPWWLVFAVPVVVVALFAFAVRSITHPPAPSVNCRLCTVEEGTFANGSLSLRELRHDIEARFPELDRGCIRQATEPGRTKIKWVVSGGDVDRRKTESIGGGRTGECLRDHVAHGQYSLVLGAGDAVPMGYTEITYILEWNPSLDPLGGP